MFPCIYSLADVLPPKIYSLSLLQAAGIYTGNIFIVTYIDSLKIPVGQPLFFHLLHYSHMSGKTRNPPHKKSLYRRTSALYVLSAAADASSGRTIKEERKRPFIYDVAGVRDVVVDNNAKWKMIKCTVTPFFMDSL